MDYETVKAGMLSDNDAYSGTHLTEVLGLELVELGPGDYHTVKDSDLLAYALPLHVTQQQYPTQAFNGNTMYRTMSGESWNQQYRDNRDAVQELFAGKVFIVREKAG